MILTHLIMFGFFPGTVGAVSTAVTPFILAPARQTIYAPLRQIIIAADQ